MKSLCFNAKGSLFSPFNFYPEPWLLSRQPSLPPASPRAMCRICSLPVGTLRAAQRHAQPDSAAGEKAKKPRERETERDLILLTSVYGVK